MKNVRKITVCLLCVLLLAGTVLSGCDVGKKSAEKVNEMLRLFIQEDVRGCCALFHPSLEYDDVLSFYTQLQDYFFIDETYQMKATSSKKEVHAGTGGSYTETAAEYTVECSGFVYYLTTRYREEEGAEGFTQFNVVSREDALKAGLS